MGSSLIPDNISETEKIISHYRNLKWTKSELSQILKDKIFIHLLNIKPESSLVTKSELYKHDFKIVHPPKIKVLIEQVPPQKVQPLQLH